MVQCLPLRLFLKKNIGKIRLEEDLPGFRPVLVVQVDKAIHITDGPFLYRDHLGLDRHHEGNIELSAVGDKDKVSRVVFPAHCHGPIKGIMEFLPLTLEILHIQLHLIAGGEYFPAKWNPIFTLNKQASALHISLFHI